MKADDPWWRAEAHEARRPLLLARSRIRRAMRSWFEARDFLEADPPGLQVSPGNEAHLHAFATTLERPDGSSVPRYLHTSPEFALKKLLSAGERRLFSLGHVWRNREGGPLHSAEFTMLEWYRAGEGYEVLMQDCAALVALAAREAGTDLLRWRAADCDPFAPPERVDLAEAVARHAGIDLMATIRPDGSTDAGALRRAMGQAGLSVAADDGWSDMLSRLLVAKVEPHLGHGRMTILDRYPVAEAALARPAPDDPRLAERFELYACGVELANGFGELTDPVVQRARFEAEMEEKARIYGDRYPLDEEFLAALATMPEASGIAMGFDRLVLLATGAPRLDMVQWAPAD